MWILTDENLAFLAQAAYLAFGPCLIGVYEGKLIRRWLRVEGADWRHHAPFVLANYASLIVWAVVWLAARAFIASHYARAALEHLQWTVLVLAVLHLVVKTVVEFPACMRVFSSSKASVACGRRGRVVRAIGISATVQTLSFLAVMVPSSLVCGAWPMPYDILTRMTFEHKPISSENGRFLLYCTRGDTVWRMRLDEPGPGTPLCSGPYTEDTAFRVHFKSDAIIVIVTDGRDLQMAEKLTFDIPEEQIGEEFYMDYRMPRTAKWRAGQSRRPKKQIHVRGSYLGEIGGSSTPLWPLWMVSFPRPVYILPNDELVAQTSDGFVVLFDLKNSRAKVLTRAESFFVMPDPEYAARLLAEQARWY